MSFIEIVDMELRNGIWYRWTCVCGGVGQWVKGDKDKAIKRGDVHKSKHFVPIATMEYIDGSQEQLT